jgi:2-hydroxy-3-oxopropionate reductase
MTTSVGVIGLGVIGKPIAERLVKAGYGVSVFDVRAEPMAALQGLDATPCAAPAEVAKRSEIIISLVSNEAQTDDVVSGAGGVLETLRAGSIFVTGSTLGPAPACRIAQALAHKGGETLDAPISGGYLAASEGMLSLMVGGKPEILARAQPVLRAFARDITYTGGVGTGQTAKLAHQLVFSLNVMALLEGLALGAAGGVAPEALKEVLKQGLANSTVLQVWPDLGPRWKGMLAATAPGAALPNMRKDLHLVLELARELGVNLYLGTQGSLIADAGTATGHNDPRL